MPHQNKVKKLNRTKPHREAMLRNMATSLIQHRTIETTEAKAKELRRVVDRIISTAKKDTLSARRQVAKTIQDKKAFKKLFNEIIPQFDKRDSGFTRVLKAGFRRGDNAAISRVELLIEKPKADKGSKKTSKKKTAEKNK
ncbi:MAG: 50S ribosomal protein L17 [Candidatus Zixiibacteriota bacterium]|nr:MAG: 50S ribosomal protein L17 [candidate division Zixibacteria bacterium]HHI02624.1 50S ribosomal protein L17 [candidate division Zixibacteria bacterium]